MNLNEKLYSQMYRIRRFEEVVLEKFSEGVFFGTTHTYLGQEANAVGILSCIRQGDIIFSNHRSHGHFLAYGGDMRSLFAELMGKFSGVCGGRGGSQHLHWKDFYSNGVQGGIVPVATGIAFAEKIKKSEKITITFLGDGTLGEGVVYESLNIASLWEIPILYVVENNQIAQTTPIALALAGKIKDRFSAFAIPSEEIESSDVLEISKFAKKLIKETRKQQFPHSLIIHTQRFGPHSKGDDPRSPEMIKQIKEYYDPIKIHGSRIEEHVRKTIQKKVENEITRAYQQSLKDPYPEPSIAA